MASFPAEGREIMLNVRIATPFDKNNGRLNPELPRLTFFKKARDKVTFQARMVNFL